MNYMMIRVNCKKMALRKNESYRWEKWKYKPDFQKI